MNDIAVQIAALQKKLANMSKAQGKKKSGEAKKKAGDLAAALLRGRSRSPKKAAANSAFAAEAAAMRAGLEKAGSLPIVQEWLKSLKTGKVETVPLSLAEPGSWVDAKLEDVSVDGVLSSEWKGLNESQRVWLLVLLLIELSNPDLTGLLASVLQPIVDGSSLRELKNLHYLFGKLRFTLDLAALVIETGLPQKQGSMAILLGLCLKPANLAGDLVSRGNEEDAKRKAAAEKKRGELAALMTSPEGTKSCHARCMAWLKACFADPPEGEAEAIEASSSGASEDSSSEDEFAEFFNFSDDERDSSPVRHSKKNKETRNSKTKPAKKAQVKCVDLEQ